MATTIKPPKTIWTSAQTVCIGDAINFSGHWETVENISLAPEDNTLCLVRVASGVLEINAQTLVEITS